MPGSPSIPPSAASVQITARLSLLTKTVQKRKALCAVYTPQHSTESCLTRNSWRRRLSSCCRSGWASMSCQRARQRKHDRKHLLYTLPSRFFFFFKPMRVPLTCLSVGVRAWRRAVKMAEESYSTSVAQWIVPLGCTDEEVRRSRRGKVWLRLENSHPLCGSFAAASHISTRWACVGRQSDNVSHQIATTWITRLLTR